MEDDHHNGTLRRLGKEPEDNKAFDITWNYAQFYRWMKSVLLAGAALVAER